MALVTIQNDQLTVVISTCGAEIQSITDKKGRERIWNGDPAFWTGRAYVLFPVAGAFRDDRYELNGESYEMPKHGFVRAAQWQVEKAEKDRVVFLFCDRQLGFPFAYTLRAIYTLKGNALEVTYSVHSEDERPFYFSVGCHEGYTTPEGIEEYALVFDEVEEMEHTIVQGSCNVHETVKISETSRTLPLKYEYFAEEALVFRSLKSRGVVLQGGKENRKIRVDFPDHPVFMVWTKPGAPFVCLECWCNGPDFVDAPADIAKKPGFMRLEQGQTIDRTHTITFIE